MKYLFRFAIFIITLLLVSVTCSYAWTPAPDDSEIPEIVNAAHEAALRLVDPAKVYSTYKGHAYADHWAYYPDDTDPATAGDSISVFADPALGAFDNWEQLNAYLHLFFTDENITKLQSLLPLMKVREDGHILVGSSNSREFGPIDRDSLLKKGTYSVSSRTSDTITVHMTYSAEDGGTFETDYHLEQTDGEWRFTDFMFPGVLYDLQKDVSSNETEAVEAQDGINRNATGALIILAAAAAFSAAIISTKKDNKSKFMVPAVVLVISALVLFNSCRSDRTNLPTSTPGNASSPETPQKTDGIADPTNEIAQPTDDPNNSADDPTIIDREFEYKKIKGTETVVVTAYLGSSGVVVIPEEIDGMPVAKISRLLFSKCADTGLIKEIVVQSDVCEIADKAFAGCPNLNKLVINCERNAAFHSIFEYEASSEAAERDGFTQVRFSDNKNVCYIPSNLVEIRYSGNKLPEAAFAGFSTVKRISLTEALTVIPEGAFSDCTALETVTAGGITTIEAKAFCGCSALTTDIPELGAVEYIMSDAFKNCSALSSLTIPESLKAIGSYAFSGCSGVKTLKYCAEDAELKGYYSPFEEMTGIESLEIGDKVRAIPRLLFYCCEFNVAKLTVPGNVKTVGMAAFSKAGTVKEIEIEAGVTEIGDGAFCSIIGLETLRLPATIVMLGTGVFRWCVDLKNVNFDDNYSVIGARMFGDCAGLEEIKLPQGLKCIEERAFEYCVSLKNVIFEGGADNTEHVSIGDRAFYICLRLQDPIAANNYASVGTAAFFGAGQWAD